MSYRDFSLHKVQHDFGLILDTTQDLFASVSPVPITAILQQTLTRNSPLALATSLEKGRSEWIIAPFFAELWNACNRRIAVFSGHSFDVDPEAGLTGVCDFVVCRNPLLLFITAPVLGPTTNQR